MAASALVKWKMRLRRSVSGDDYSRTECVRESPNDVSESDLRTDSVRKSEIRKR